MFVYKKDIIKALEEKGYNAYVIKKENLLTDTTIAKLANGDTSLELGTFDILCSLLECELMDILEHTPNTSIIQGGEFTELKPYYDKLEAIANNLVGTMPIDDLPEKAIKEYNETYNTDFIVVKTDEANKWIVRRFTSKMDLVLGCKSNPDRVLIYPIFTNVSREAL